MTTIYQPKRILITGGAGFIGSNFIRWLLQQNVALEQIVNLDALTYAGSLDNLKDLPQTVPYHFMQGDINDTFLIKALLRDYRIDTVVHFAAESHVDRSIVGPQAFIQTNIQGTFNLLECARDYWLNQQHWSAAQCRFHHISTDEVYGSLTLDAPAFTEHTPFAPNSPYAASKAASDHLVRAYQHTYQLPTVITNCSNNYGPYQHSEKFIPTVIRSCLTQQPIPLYGNGANIRDWLYVIDHCQGIWTVLTQAAVAETYNIGGDNEWSNLELVQVLCRLLDEMYPAAQPYHHLIQFVSDRPGHDLRYAIDASKIQHDLGWKSQQDFLNGLRQTIRYFGEKISDSRSQWY